MYRVIQWWQEFLCHTTTKKPTDLTGRGGWGENLHPVDPPTESTDFSVT